MRRPDVRARGRRGRDKSSCSLPYGRPASTGWPSLKGRPGDRLAGILYGMTQLALPLRPLRPLARLAQVQESGRTGGEAGGRGRLGLNPSRGASMANDEQVALLKQSVLAWNKWRDENPNIRPNLSGSPLTKREPPRGEPQRGGPRRGDPCGSEPLQGEPKRRGPARREPDDRRSPTLRTLTSPAAASMACPRGA
jgi:hypothetical protein